VVRPLLLFLAAFTVPCLEDIAPVRADCEAPAAERISSQDSQQVAVEPVAPTMPLAEVRPGMEATVRTVFEGGVVEEFGAEIVGVMDNFLGPGQDLILARLKGQKVEQTGVAGGMSGSPVYVGGRLLGALSYRVGVFLKEPIAGITPIEYMLRVGESPGPPAARRSDESARKASGSPAGGAGGFEPIETPLVAVGVPAPVLEMYASELTRLGLGGLGPGGGLLAPAGGAAPSNGPAPALLRLAPGDAVAAQLVTGDISLAGTGTVTLVSGDRVYAFGHPAFLSGATQLPTARAEIYLTLSSLQASNKMSRVLDTIGTFTQSRLPALTGVIGPKPKMIPVTVKISRPSETDAAPRRFGYDVVAHRELTPMLVGLVAAASLMNTASFSDEMTISLSGRVGLEGHEDLILNDVYTGFTAAQSAAASMARDVQDLVGAMIQNRFEEPRITSVDLDLASVEKGALSVVEGVYPTRSDLQPGEEVELRVLIRPYRGGTYTRRFHYRIPEGTPPGPMAVYVGGANLISAVERVVLARQASQADDLDQIISLLNRLRTSDKLYLKVTRRHGGAIVQNEVLPALPPSVLSTLSSNRGTGEVTPLAETTIHEQEIPLGQILVGGTVVPLHIR